MNIEPNRWRRINKPDPRIIGVEYVPDELRNLLLRNIVRFQEKKCWGWTGRTDDDGYGICWWRSRHYRAHRLAFVVFNGSIVNGLHVLHSCDNPPCGNPAHLFLGDQQVNIDDMYAKGRECHAFGEDHGLSKLKEDEVRDVFRLAWAGQQSQREIAGCLAWTPL